MIFSATFWARERSRTCSCAVPTVWIARCLPLRSLAQKVAEKIIQQAVVRVEGAARFGELLPPFAESLFDLRARRHGSLIGQGNAAMIATPLVGGREERGPTGIRRRHRVDGHHIAVPRIGEQSLAVLQNAIP